LLTIDNRSLPHQYTPGDMWDCDEEGSSILIDVTVDGQLRKVTTHAARDGFIYTFERANGQTLMAKPYVSAVNWTKTSTRRQGSRSITIPTAMSRFIRASRNRDIARSPECRPATMQGGLSGTVTSPPGRAVP
jgi:glucose dehydrogenase